jgi:DNA-directed RNA polymerase subunit RPC12/RpoP
MPYTLQCPHCGHRVFTVTGTCTGAFDGEIDCADWHAPGELEVLHVHRYDTMDEDVSRIECAQCGKRIDQEEATTAYEEAYRQYEDSLPDPNQLPHFA